MLKENKESPKKRRFKRPEMKLMKLKGRKKMNKESLLCNKLKRLN